MARVELAPPTDNERLLAVPDLSAWPQTTRDEQRRLEEITGEFHGRPLAQLRRAAREEAFAAARDYLANSPTSFDSTKRQAPLVVTGHQPEMFHPGVWIKSFAAHRLADAVGGSALQVIIDNDTLKASAVRVPAGGPEQFLLGHVPFDRWEAELPFEERTVVDEAVFAEFADRVSATMARIPFTPMVQEYWKQARTAATDNLGERLSHARRALERSMGVANLEVPLSQICRTSTFSHFLEGILLDLPRLSEIYNQALADYRQRHKVRSRNHPASDLGHDGDWSEAPFWIWHVDRPIRQPLWVRISDSSIQARAGEKAIGAIAHNVAEDRLVLRSFEEQLPGWKIRPRALMTTLFLRVFLADYFIHGIGGGKYDAVTDAIIREYLGFEPPKFGVLSATLYLPRAGSPNADDQVRAERHRARDLYWNPDRYLHDALREREPIAQLIERKIELQSDEPSDRRGRRERYYSLREINQELRAYVESSRTAALERASKHQEELASDHVLSRRDYPFFLYPKESLKRLMDQVRCDGELDGTS